MAAPCMGAFGQYKYAWSRHAQLQPIASQEPSRAGDLNTVWVTKRYIPTDLRVTAPVPRHKPVVPDARTLPKPDDHWVAHSEAPLNSFSREHEEPNIFKSSPSTRCEEYSTLRQMLPSRGRPVRIRPANWGTGYVAPPSYSTRLQRAFPHINSPMTRYADDMHKTNRLFKLY